MDAFQELGISATAQTPQRRGVGRNVSELLAAIAAGTAITASAIFALVVVAVILATVIAGVQMRNASPNDSCSPLIGCVP
jgi:hypothetical protein